MWLFSKLCWRISWSDQADPHHIVIFSIFIWNKNAKHLENEDSSLEEQLKALSPHSRCLIPVLLPCCSCSARPLLFCIGISAWQMALSQDAASTPACTQNTSEAVSSSKEWPWSPGNTGTDRWDGPRTCSTSDRGISYHREKEVTSKKKHTSKTGLMKVVVYFVVLGAGLILVQSDALQVQDPIMSFPLKKTKTSDTSGGSHGRPQQSHEEKKAVPASHQRVCVGVVQQPSFSKRSCGPPFGVMHRLDDPHQRDVAAEARAEEKAEHVRRKIQG